MAFFSSDNRLDGLAGLLTNQRVRTGIWSLLFVVGVIFLVNYLWFGRLPYSVHPTDGGWLPARDPIRSAGVLAHPGAGEYRVQPYLDEAPRKILLITIDTLRADHLSSYGYLKKTSPFIDSLAKRGLKFTRAYAPTSTTLPSHAALMTGLYPMQLNVLTNYEKLWGRFRTLAELLQQKNYTTAGFVSTNRHFSSGNLDQGFQHFDEPSRPQQAFKAPWSDTRFNLFYRPAERTLRRARDWIQKRTENEKQFLWIHLFDPHFPYAYRPGYHDPLRYEDKTRQTKWIQFLRRSRGVDLLEAPLAGRSDNPYISTYRLYDGEIRYVDSRLRSFYDGLEQSWDQDPFTVITSDHGEGMGNHDWWGHSKYVYNEQIRVPLIIYHPDLKSRSEINRIVELNDLYTTLAREARVSYQALGDTLLPNSFPLQNLMKNSESDPFGYAFASRKKFTDEMLDARGWMRWRWRQLTGSPPKNPLDPEHRWREMTWPGRQHVLLNETQSYVHNTALRDEFYDQHTDFYQTTNRIDRGQIGWKDYASTMRKILEEIRGKQAPEPRNVDKKTRGKLKGLGYVN